MPVWLQVVVSLASAALGAGALNALIKSMGSRGLRKVSQTVELADAALRQVNELQERVKEAEKSARQARDEAEEFRQEMVAARREAERAFRAWRRLRMAILHPEATVDQLRELVEADNGLPGART